MKGDAASTTFISSPKSVLSDLLANPTHASILYLFDPLHNIIKRSACFRSRLIFAITESNHDRDGKVSGNWSNRNGQCRALPKMCLSNAHRSGESRAALPYVFGAAFFVVFVFGKQPV